MVHWGQLPTNTSLSLPCSSVLSKHRRADTPHQSHEEDARGLGVWVKNDRHLLLGEGGSCPQPVPRNECNILGLHRLTVRDTGLVGLHAQETNATCPRPASPSEAPLDFTTWLRSRDPSPLTNEVVFLRAISPIIRATHWWGKKKRHSSGVPRPRFFSQSCHWLTVPTLAPLWASISLAPRWSWWWPVPGSSFSHCIWQELRGQPDSWVGITLVSLLPLLDLYILVHVLFGLTRLHYHPYIVKHFMSFYFRCFA